MSILITHNFYTTNKSVFNRDKSGLPGEIDEAKSDLADYGTFTEVDDHISKVGVNLYAQNIKKNDAIYS